MALTGCTNKPELVTELQTRKEKVLNMTDELCAGKQLDVNYGNTCMSVFCGSLSHIQNNICISYCFEVKAHLY